MAMTKMVTPTEAGSVLSRLPLAVRVFLADLIASAWMREVPLAEWPKARWGEVSAILDVCGQDVQPGALLTTGGLEDDDDPSLPNYVVVPTDYLETVVYALMVGVPVRRMSFFEEPRLRLDGLSLAYFFEIENFRR